MARELTGEESRQAAAAKANRLEQGQYKGSSFGRIRTPEPYDPTHLIEESEKFAKFGKFLKAGAMVLPLIGAGITGAQAADKIDAINNSDLSPEAKAAAHGFNAGMTLDALLDPTVAGSMAGQEAAKKGMVAKYGERITQFLVQTDAEALAEARKAMGGERFASAQAIIDALPKDPAVLKAMAENKDLSPDVRHLAEGQMMIVENKWSLNGKAFTGQEILDKTAAAMYERQEKAGTQTAQAAPEKQSTQPVAQSEPPEKPKTPMELAMAQAKEKPCPQLECTGASEKHDKAPTQIAAAGQQQQPKSAGVG